MNYDIINATYDFKCRSTNQMVRKGDACIRHEGKLYHLDAMEDLLDEKAR